jgi:hypothetical protein
MPHRNVGHFFYNIFPSCLNCSSSGAETRILCVYVPLGFARGANLGSARGADLGFARCALGSQTVRRAKPRREIQCIYLHPSAPLGVHSALLGLHSALLGLHSALLGLHSALLGVHSALLGVKSIRHSPHPRGMKFLPQYLYTFSHMCAYKIGFGNI